MIKVVLDEGAFLPKRAHSTDAGLDFFTPCDVCVNGGGSVVVDTGVHIAIPEGWVGFVKSKSGLMAKSSLVTDGTVDSGYTGSVAIKLMNHGDKKVRFEKGNKIAQMVIVPCLLGDTEEVDELPKTDRGEGGFGSTGK
jgi:dUTP pyrophosphatase